MKTVIVKFVDGRTIEAPARGKVLAKDYKLTDKQVNDLFEANSKKVMCEIKTDFEEIKRLEGLNQQYYEGLPKYFNYNKKGQIVNKFWTREEFYASFNKRKKK